MRARRPFQAVIAGLVVSTLGQAAPARSKVAALPGTYVNNVGSVIIKKTAKGFYVEISTAEPTRGVWACDFAGSGKLDDSGTLVIVSAPEVNQDTATVKLTLTLKRDVLTVDEKRSGNDVEFCGYRGFLHGDYRRKVKP
jgi:hypothetical protein